MALELLSGPHDIVDINDGDTPLANVLGGTRALWVDPLGLVAEVSVLGLALVQMDGSACLFSEFQNNINMGLSLLGGSLTDPLLGEPWYSYHGYANGTPAPEYELNRITHSLGRTLNASGASDVLFPYARLADRYLRALGTAVRSFTTDGSALTVERVIPGMSNAQNLSWAREAGCVWVGSTAGLLTLYDHVAKVERGPLHRLGMTCSGVWYSKKHDVFVSLHNAGGGVWQTRVWAHAVRPASVSAPVAESAVQAGRVVSLKCQVLGDASEPCEGEVVAWALASGAGSLSPLTSETDATGWARTRYTVPLDATGSADINVEVAV